MTFSSFSRELRKAFPQCKPVRIRRCHTPIDIVGETTEYEDRWYIVIDKLISDREQKETLLHEYAHVMSGIGCEIHDDDWGICYARLMRWWQEEV